MAGTQSLQIDDVALDICASEPIHIPGTVQPRGVMLGLDADCNTVLFASGNTAAELGAAPAALLGKSAALVLGVELHARICAGLAEARDGTVILVELQELNGVARRAVLAHRYDRRVIIELVNEAGDLTPVDALSLATAGIAARNDIVASTTANGASDDALLHLAHSVAEEVRRIAGYDRVIVYRFADDGHGWVIAESCEPGMEPFLGLHYPASDIPPQARALYVEQRVRACASASERQVPLLAANDTAASRPLDLRHAVLRSFSPVHREYLRNMRVDGTMSVSIIVSGRLWGLISCHHREPRWPSHGIRAALDVLSEFLSVQVTVVEQVARAETRVAVARARELFSARFQRASLPLDELLDDLAALVPAAGVAVVAGDAVVTRGAAPSIARIREICTWLDETHTRCADFESLQQVNPALADIADTASGLLVRPLAVAPDARAFWFRGEAPTTVRWAGAPHKLFAEVHPPSSPMRVQPRRSFAEWREVKRGHAVPFTASERALADIVLPRERRGGIEYESDPIATTTAAFAADGARLEQRLRDARKLWQVGQATGGIANDFNALLTGIVGNAARAFAGLPAGALTRDGVEAVVASADHAARLCRELLVAVGRSRFTGVAVNLADLCAQVVHGARAIAPASCALALPAHEGTADVHGDQLQLRQLVTGLVMNGIDAIGEAPGQVIVSVRECDASRVQLDAMQGGRECVAGCYVELRVHDTGRGISAAMVALMQHPRFVSEYAGRGLGIATIIGVVRAHRGAWGVAEAPGGGTEFTVLLPAL